MNTTETGEEIINARVHLVLDPSMCVRNLNERRAVSPFHPALESHKRSSRSARELYDSRNEQTRTRILYLVHEGFDGSGATKKSPAVEEDSRAKKGKGRQVLAMERRRRMAAQAALLQEQQQREAEVSSGHATMLVLTPQALFSI